MTDPTPKLPVEGEHPADIWRPFPAAWADFRARHPDLNLGDSATAQSRFRDRHSAELVAAGALLRAPRGLWFAHARRFDAAAFSVLLGLRVVHVESRTVHEVAP